MDLTKIIKGCKAKEPKYQKELVGQYASRFMAVCQRYAYDGMGAEDLLQEAFIEIFKNIQKYRGEGSFEGWMHRITVFTCIKFIKKNKIKFEQPLQNGFMEPEIAPEIYAALEAKDWEDLINELPDGYREIFNMYVIDEFSHKEIAQKLEIEVGTSRVKLNRAKGLLRKKLLKMKLLLA